MSVDVAIAEAGPAGEVRFYGRIGGDLEALDKVIRKLRAQGVELQFAYEAGPCGYQIYRHLTAQGYSCLVAAPALIPRRPGDRLKNDRRDALNLARLLRAGELTPVRVPDADDEAMRDLTRAREDAVSVERRAKQRTAAFLLRHGRRFPGKTTWGRGHWRWLLQQVMEHPAQQIVLQEYLDAVREAGARVQRLTGQIREILSQWRRAPFVAAYQALRGVSIIVAATVVAEVGELSRFNNPKELTAYLGLVPSEHSSGATVRRGRITKTGNGHARSALEGDGPGCGTASSTFTLGWICRWCRKPFGVACRSCGGKCHRSWKSSSGKPPDREDFPELLAIDGLSGWRSQVDNGQDYGADQWCRYELRLFCRFMDSLLSGGDREAAIDMDYELPCDDPLSFPSFCISR